MRALVTSLAVLTIIISLPPSEDAALERIRRIENGLTEFSAPSEMFVVDSTSSRARVTLSERMKHYNVPGVSVAVIDNDNVNWVRGYGVIKAGSEIAVTPETFFQAASTTKFIVSTVVLRLVEQGALDLDQDVNEYLKSWKIPENQMTKEKKVTLRLLLTHQAGLNRPDGGFSWDGAPTLTQTLQGIAPATNHPAIIEYAPGRKWQYSNFGYVVIQLLLEDVTGKPFPQTAEETLFQPLGMKNSTLMYPLSAERGKKEALPHDAEGRTHEAELHPTAVANGGLVTTPHDLALFTIELIRTYRGESDRILSKEMARLMFHSEVELGPDLLGIPLGDGLGVLLNGQGRGFSFLHPGDNYPGASCWLVGFPNTGQGAVIMTNGAKGNLLAMEIIFALTNEYRWP